MANTKLQSFSRPPWERMMRFHHLIKEEAYPNCNQVAKEFEVSWRTIMRDVDFMKCRLKLPIEFDQQRNSYFYTEPVNQLPHLPITEAEMFAMLVAHSNTQVANPAVTNARFASLHGLPVAPSPSRRRPFRFSNRALVTSLHGAEAAVAAGFRLRLGGGRCAPAAIR